MNHTALILAMAEHDRGSAQRIQHLVKVHEFARVIGLAEGLNAEEMEIIEAAAITHDIGIRPALEKYGSDAGPLQEREGPPPARLMMEDLGYSADVVERVCRLISVHHTLNPVEGMPHQILLEADALVNLFENSAPPERIRASAKQLFKTQTGLKLLACMFPEALK